MTPEVITSLVQKYADPVRKPGFSRKKGVRGLLVIINKVPKVFI